MKYLLSFVIIMSLFTSAQAQFFVSEDFNWDEKAVYENLEVDDSTDIYIIKTKQLFRYFYNSDDELVEDYLYYRKLFVNSSDAIEGLNKIYISQTTENKGLVKFRARVINPSGKTIELKEKDILTGTEEESGSEYTYFALNGLQEGSQIEYFYIKRLTPDYNGITVDMESHFPIGRFEVDIITPWNLVFKGKCYNTTYALESDTSLENENRLFLHLDSIEAYKEEQSSFREANVARLIFKLDQNLYTGKRDIISYGYITQNVVNAINSPYEKKEEKALKKIIKEIDKYQITEELSTARKIEDYIKAEYSFVDVSNPVLTNLGSMYENKAFNQYGALRLYTRLFKQYDVPYQVVYTTDRSEMAFDPDFQTNVFLDDLILYLPEEDDYLDYTTPTHRIGYISSMNRGNYGLFIDEVSLGEEKTVGVSEVKWIKAKPASFTVDTLLVDVEFGDDLYDNTININRVLSGYTAGFYQPLFELITDETFKKEFRESLIKYVDSEAQLEDLTIANDEARLLGVKPLRASGKLKESLFMEKAGPNYLFKVGTLIGPQAEMYEDKEKKERKANVQTDHSRTYFRVLRFDVPEGFQVTGLEELNMDEKLTIDGDVTARFQSTYSREGNSIEVEILEFYNEVEYDKQFFEDYRRVINAAADFNKKTILLKKV
ncbi:MAG: DUF3857 domain-containing protein [Owenweeksia sp.]